MLSQAQFRLRPNFLPKSFSDYPLFVFVTAVIPITFWFQLWVVFYSLFPPPSATYSALLALSVFALHNVLGNFLALLLCDTSIRGRLMPDETLPGVKYCAACETLTPPRSYHCPNCDICILKRDHHCVFTSCCIGHYNHRFFIVFILYVVLSVSFCLPFNLYFLWDLFSLRDFSLVTSLLFPVFLFIFEFGPENIESEQIYIMLFAIQLGGLAFCLGWIYFHMKLILRGTIIYEMRKRINLYNLGRMKNIEMVFGERWYLTWISPLVPSALPSDGVTFPMRKNDD